MAEITVEIPVNGEGESEMTTGEIAGHSLADMSVMSTVHTGMAAGAAAASEARIRRFDQLAEDSASMWAIALTTPTVMTALGFRVTQQSSGYPAAEGTGTSAPKA